MNHMLMYIGEKNDIRTCTSTVRTGYTMEHTSRLLEKRILSVSTGEKRMISFIVCHFSFYSPCSTTNPSRSKAFLFLVIHLGVVAAFTDYFLQMSYFEFFFIKKKNYPKLLGESSILNT